MSIQFAKTQRIVSNAANNSIVGEYISFVAKNYIGKDVFCYLSVFELMSLARVSKSVYDSVSNSPIVYDSIREKILLLRKKSKIVNKATWQLCDLSTKNTRVRDRVPFRKITSVHFRKNSSRSSNVKTISQFSPEGVMWLNALAKVRDWPIFVTKVFKDGYVDPRISKKTQTNKCNLARNYLEENHSRRLELIRPAYGDYLSNQKDKVNKSITYYLTLLKNTLVDRTCNFNFSNIYNLLMATHCIQKVDDDVVHTNTAFLKSRDGYLSDDYLFDYSEETVDELEFVENKKRKPNKKHYTNKINKVTPRITVMKLEVNGVVVVPKLMMKMEFHQHAEKVVRIYTVPEFECTNGLCCAIRADGSVLATREFWESSAGIIPDFLNKFNNDIWENAGNIGRITNCCIFCGHNLTTKQSLEDGFGSTCRKNWNITPGMYAANNLLTLGSSLSVEGAPNLNEGLNLVEGSLHGTYMCDEVINLRKRLNQYVLNKEAGDLTSPAKTDEETNLDSFVIYGDEVTIGELRRIKKQKIEQRDKTLLNK